MSDFEHVLINADKLTTTYQQGTGTGPEGGLTWDEYQAELAPFFERTCREDWQAVAAWLAAQLVGERALTHADTHHAVLQIARIVHDYEDRRRVGPPAEPPAHDTPDMLALLEGDPE